MALQIAKALPINDGFSRLWFQAFPLGVMWLELKSRNQAYSCMVGES
jgi:hypothetical protein